MATSVPQILQLGADLLASTITQFFGPTEYGSEPALGPYPHFHTGVDIVLPTSGDVGSTGPNVRSVSSGVVTAVIPSSTGYGNHILVRSPNGFTYLYGHLHDFNSLLYNSGRQAGYNLQVGDQVHVGDIIGHEGSTGNSSGPHLHLEVRDPSGQPIDLGRTPSAIIYSLYHDLGWGAGYLPGQNPDFIPSATQPGPPGIYSNVPVPLPGNPGISHSPGCNPPRAGCPQVSGDFRFTFGKTGSYGPSDPTGITGGNPSDPNNPGGTPIGYYPTNGILSGVGSSILSAIGLDPSKVVEFAVVLGAGAVFLIVGLVKLGKEEPVRVVVQPVVSAGKGTAKVAGAVAAAA